ncbi:MAG: hypothetical protein ACYC35_12810 [Pirellulales bacterium]
MPRPQANPMHQRGRRRIRDKYSALIGVKLFAYLHANPGDWVGLGQIPGHENLNTRNRHAQRTQRQLTEASERATY